MKKLYFLLLCSFAIQAEEIYRCDNNGKVSYEAVPCTNGLKYVLEIQKMDPAIIENAQFQLNASLASQAAKESAIKAENDKILQQNMQISQTRSLQLQAIAQQNQANALQAQNQSLQATAAALQQRNNILWWEQNYYRPIREKELHDRSK